MGSVENFLRPKCAASLSIEKELDIQVEPREDSGPKIGISKSSALMVFGAGEDEVTGAGV